MLFYLTKFGFSSIEFMAELPSIFNYATDVKMRYQLNMLERKIYIAKPNYVVSKQDSIMLKSILEQIAHICIAMMTEKANGNIPDNQWGDIIDVHIAARDNWIICIQKADNIALFIQCFERLRKTLHDCYAKYVSSQTSTVACRRPTRRSNIASDQESTHAAQWSLHYVSLYKWLKWTVLTLAWLSDSALEHKDFVLTMIRKEIKGQGIFGQYTENIEKEHPIIIHWLLGWSTGNLFFINDAGVGFNPVQSITYRTIEWVSDMVEPVVYNFFLRILHAVGMAPTVANTVLMALLICYRLIIRDQMITVFNFITRRLLQVVGYCICTCSDNSLRFVRWFWNLDYTEENILPTQFQQILSERPLYQVADTETDIIINVAKKIHDTRSRTASSQSVSRVEVIQDFANLILEERYKDVQVLNPDTGKMLKIGTRYYKSLIKKKKLRLIEDIGKNGEILLRLMKIK